MQTIRQVLLTGCALFALSHYAGAAEDTQPHAETSDLSYESYVHSNNRFKCLYGYAAEKTGDHEAAMAIFNDCIERWNDVYSMIWLAQMYEAGVSVPRDLQRSTALMKRGAHVEADSSAEDGAGYATLARYHYGKALFYGIGTNSNKEEAVYWLKRAADEGLPDAVLFLRENSLR